jgi:uncharacterized protein (DUF58 family)
VATAPARARVRVVPGRLAIVTIACCAAGILVALLLGVSVSTAAAAAAACVLVIAVAAILDGWSSLRAWRLSSPSLTRRLPSAFAIGVKRPVQITVAAEGPATWDLEIHDHADAIFLTHGMPARLSLAGGTGVDLTYIVTPTRRGEVRFAPADVRVRSRWRLCELFVKLGDTEIKRVYPDFAQIARYAWLAGDRRLQEIGIKTYQQRGQGTDFKQLSEYRVGDSLRHMDWRATLRVGKPIVREFQDERDQCVLFLVDCGRRMRADDRHGGIGTTHFDQVLNAVMLLSYVALRQGDAVGAMTFGTPDDQKRSFAPRKGAHALDAMMGQLYGVQPTPTHSDYLTAAQDLLRYQRRRALVIIITNFRDEDSTELRQALRLLRAHHLVLLASLREHIVRELASQPLVSGDAAIEVASAHLYEQSRRDSFNRLAARDGLMIDAEPQRLGVDLVNRYHAMKRAGTI